MQFTIAAAAVLTGLAALGTTAVQPEDAERPGIDSMLGTWDVDLRPTPDADAYIMKLTLERDGEGEGELAATFYNGSEATNIVTNASFDRPHVAFTTTDGAGNYHTQFSLTPEGTLKGTTHAVGRGFLSVWKAERAE